MGPASRRPGPARRLLPAAAAALVFAAHALLVPLHLVAHHVGEVAAAHLAAHAHGHGHGGGHGHGHGGMPDDAHDFGDHGGAGHLLEVQPRTPAKAPALPAPAPGALPVARSVPPAPLVRAQRAPLAAHAPERPPPRGPAALRGPPVG